MRRVRVGDVLQLERRRVEINPTDTYTLIGVYSFGKGIFHRPPTLGIELGDYKFSEICPEDLVLSNIQSWEGAIGYATAVDQGTIGTHRFLTYTPKDRDEIDANWARYFFLSEAGLPLIQKAAPGSVTRNRTLSVDRFEAIEIPLPDIDEQRRIAAHLDRVAALNVELNHRCDRSGALGGLLNQALQKALTGLRRAHPNALLGDVATWHSGGTPAAKAPEYYGGDIPWAVIGDLNDGVVSMTERSLTDSGLLNSSAKIVPPGTVLVAMYGSIGKLGLASIPLATNQAIANAVPNPNYVTGDYLFAYLRAIRPELVAAGKGGAQQNISLTVLKNFSIPVPISNTHRQEFVAAVDLALRQHRLGEQLVRRSQTLRGAMMPAALNEAFAGLG